MEKKNKIIILLLVVAVVLALAVWLALKGEGEAGETNVNANINTGQGIINNLEEGDLDGDVSSTPEPVDVPADFDWQESLSSPDFSVEFMTDEEKTKIGIPLERRAQVLSRDAETGLILAYKIIESDEDIVTGPQE